MEALGNGAIAELLARAAEQEPERHRERALRRAAQAALAWPEEAAALVAQGRSPTELAGVGPWIAARIELWLRAPPDVPPPPRVRRGFVTLAAARRTLASHPGWRSALRGDLQTHSTYTDGTASIRQMAAALATLGHEYAAVTDHSVGLAIANGMSEDRLAAQGREIGEVNEELSRSGARLRLLRGIEMNLSPDGEGDMSAGSLARLDLVLGAFHSRLRIATDQTGRYLAALRNRTIHVLAHPRGRKYGIRPGLEADWEAVFRAAAEAGVALEVDCSPWRQDLDVDLLRAAAEADAWISVGTDAHHPEETAYLEIGLAALAVAGVRPERVLNAMSREELLAWAGRDGGPRRRRRS